MRFAIWEVSISELSLPSSPMRDVFHIMTDSDLEHCT